MNIIWTESSGLLIASIYWRGEQYSVSSPLAHDSPKVRKMLAKSCRMTWDILEERGPEGLAHPILEEG